MLITELPRITDVLLWEKGEEENYTRDAVTLANGTLASTIGTVLGLQSVGLATAVVAGTNTGTGLLVKDATNPVEVNATVGAYGVLCIAAGTNSATFQVLDPHGLDLGELILTGALASGTFSNRVKFAITQTATQFAVGDSFTVTVAAGTGLWVVLNPAAVDGSQNAAGVLLTPVPATLTANTTVVVIDRGPATLKSTGLVWPAGYTSTQIAAATAQLQALGLTTRIAYGV